MNIGIEKMLIAKKMTKLFSLIILFIFHPFILYIIYFNPENIYKPMSQILWYLTANTVFIFILFINIMLKEKKLIYQFIELFYILLQFVSIITYHNYQLYLENNESESNLNTSDIQNE